MFIECSCFLFPIEKFPNKTQRTFNDITDLEVLFFRNFLVSEKFWDRTGRGKGYHDVPLIFFSLTLPKHIVEKHYCVSKKFWYRKFSLLGEGLSQLSVDISLFHSTKKNPQRNHSVSQKSSFIEES